MPGSNPGDLSGVTMTAECVDDDGNPVDECVTTEFSAALTGTLAVSPLWLQIGPDFANVGAGLSAAAIGTISLPAPRGRRRHLRRRQLGGPGELRAADREHGWIVVGSVQHRGQRLALPVRRRGRR